MQEKEDFSITLVRGFHTEQKMKCSIKDLLSKSADLVTFTEELLNGKFHFLYSVNCLDFKFANNQGTAEIISFCRRILSKTNNFPNLLDTRKTFPLNFRKFA